jgi:hypothetical protein
MKYLLYIILIVVVLITTGCVSENQKTVVTPTKTATIPTIVVKTTLSPPATAKPTTLVLTTTPAPAFLTFIDQGIVFDYPSYLSTAASLQQMKSILQSQGVELITVLRSSDNLLTLQVGRQQNPASIESLIEDKRAISDTVNSQGMTLMGEKFIKYTVSKITLPKQGVLVMGYAEKDNGQTGISYWQLHGGYEYAIIFIYPNAQSADSGQAIRTAVIDSIRFT